MPQLLLLELIISFIKVDLNNIIIENIYSRCVLSIFNHHCALSVVIHPTKSLVIVIEAIHVISLLINSILNELNTLENKLKRYHCKIVRI